MQEFISIKNMFIVDNIRGIDVRKWNSFDCQVWGCASFPWNNSKKELLWLRDTFSMALKACVSKQNRILLSSLHFPIKFSFRFFTRSFSIPLSVCWILSNDSRVLEILLIFLVIFPFFFTIFLESFSIERIVIIIKPRFN